MKNPIVMEDYFNPGFKTKPAVHMGSQTLLPLRGIPEEMAWEGCVLAGASSGDVGIVRNTDEDYINYWKTLMDGVNIINITKKNDPGAFLTEILVKDKNLQKEIKEKMSADSHLMVFFPTELEEKLAHQLGIPLHGKSNISNKYGTKSGIRRLAQKVGLPMSTGYICSTFSGIKRAFTTLKKDFPSMILKHDLSFSGYYSKKITTQDENILRDVVDKLMGRPFQEGVDIVVIEGWVESKASLCAHIEILPHQKPVVCAAWQQVIDTDGITFIGAGPLRLSPKALKSFLTIVNKLAQELQKKGAIGSFGPDFLVISAEDKNYSDDTVLLTELNARVPFSAYPLEVIKQVKGIIGNGFLSQHIKLKKSMGFKKIRKILEKENLLITKRGKNVRGVVPYDMGLLPWKLFDVVIMANNWDEVQIIERKLKILFT